MTSEWYRQIEGRLEKLEAEMREGLAEVKQLRAQVAAAKEWLRADDAWEKSNKVGRAIAREAFRKLVVDGT